MCRNREVGKIKNGSRGDDGRPPVLIYARIVGVPKRMICPTWERPD
jgi:hypothetical protein